jgi:hypothetical protein
MSRVSLLVFENQPQGGYVVFSDPESQPLTGHVSSVAAA